MSRRSAILLLTLGTAVTLAVWWLLWPERVAYTNFPPPANGSWVAFGDSLTAGYGAAPGNDYPTLLGQRLGINIVNLGQSGATTGDGLRRLEQVTRLNPRVVLLCLGGNDGLQQVPRAQTFGNLAAIIDHLHQQGAFVVLIGVRSATVRDKSASYFRELAREKRVLYVPDMLRGVLGRPQLMADYIHPNDEGYAVIAGRLEKELQPLLPGLR
jgi:acyl-CoA thioesterase I